MSTNSDPSVDRATPGSRASVIWPAVVIALVGALVLGLRSSGLVGQDAGTALLETSPGELLDYPCLESDGTELRTTDLLDRYRLVYFMFTSCPATCPPLTSQMLRLQRATEGVDDVGMMSFTVDPKNDTVEALAEYAEKVGADRTRWKFLFANQGVVHDIAYNGLKMGHPTEVIAHSNDFALLDREGKVRAYYHPLKDTGWVDVLLADLERLRAEE